MIAWLLLTCAELNGGGCKSSDTPPFPIEDEPDFSDDVVDDDDNKGCFCEPFGV